MKHFFEKNRIETYKAEFYYYYLQGDLSEQISKQGNLGDMRQIRVTRQCFQASSPRGHFFEKTKTPLLDKVYVSTCTKFQVCFVFLFGKEA